MPRRSSARLALVALLGGAVGIAFAPLFVRWSEVGPSATAFYRLLLALPFLAAWKCAVRQRQSPHPSGTGSTAAGPRTGPGFDYAGLVLPGVLFAGDLALWHWSIRYTSVANATLLANLAPLVVTVVARVLFQERITPAFLAGLGLALGGATMVMSQGLSVTTGHLKGDCLGVATALFYGGYMLSVKHARRRHPTAHVMIWTSLSACPVLIALAAISGESLWPRDAAGWIGLLGLALVSQVGGQGLIAYALAHLPASFSSVSLLLQPVVAAWLAWIFLGEPLAWLQAIGGAVVLAGIAVAGRGGQFRNGTRPGEKRASGRASGPDHR